MGNRTRVDVEGRWHGANLPRAECPKGQGKKDRPPWERHLDELLRLEEGLTDWELKFVESMAHQRDAMLKDPLPAAPTVRQALLIDKIWEARCQ
jgi:hypothetical protein